MSVHVTDMEQFDYLLYYVNTIHMKLLTCTDSNVTFWSFLNDNRMEVYLYDSGFIL